MIMENTVTERDLLKMLGERVQKVGQSELGRQWEVTPQLLCDVLKGRRKFGTRLLDRLGYEERIIYIRKRRAS